MAENPIKSPLQKAIVEYLKEIGVTQRSFGDTLKVSETRFGTYNRMTSAMGVDLLDKIISNYPGVKAIISKYLSGNNDQNSTPVQEIDELKDKLIKALEELSECRKSHGKAKGVKIKKRPNNYKT